jgi:hypothetical protein
MENVWGLFTTAFGNEIVSANTPLGKEDYMHKIIKQSMVILIIIALVFVPAAYAAESISQNETQEATEGKMLIDFFLFRPLGVVALVAGSAVFVVSLPFSALGGNAKTVGRTMVADPFFYTFDRKLGAF